MFWYVLGRIVSDDLFIGPGKVGQIGKSAGICTLRHIKIAGGEHGKSTGTADIIQMLQDGSSGGFLKYVAEIKFIEIQRIADFI